MRILMITIISLALAVPAFAGVYKWTDKNGKIHFTDSLSKVPLDQRTEGHIRKMESTVETSGGPNNLPTAAAPKSIGSKQEGSHGKDTGVDKQKVKDLQKLIQKKHYSH